MRTVLSIVAFALALALSATAEAKVTRFHSKHPIPGKVGGGFCYIEVPHVHAFGPNDPRMYRVHDDEYYFVGDPASFGYEGPRYSYYGAHPVVEADSEFGEPVYCYMNGAHYHWYQPTATAQFELKGGAYWYVGAYDPVFYRGKPRYVVVNDAYQPITYERPVVDVTVAPPAFHGAIVATPVGAHGHAVVAGPVVSAGVHVALPPPPSVHVGVGFGFGAPTVVERERVIVAEPAPRTVIIRERGHHDNGRHRGWYKHGKH